MCKVCFPFGHHLLAEHGQVVDGVILDHVEAVLLKTQPVALAQNIQQSPRSYSYAFALSGEDILHDSHLLEVPIRLIP
jgi:hypothetical protein